MDKDDIKLNLCNMIDEMFKVSEQDDFTFRVKLELTKGFYTVEHSMKFMNYLEDPYD